MANLSPEETNVQGSAMVTWLHQMVADCHKLIAELQGEKAVLEYKLAKLLTPKAPDAP